MIEPTSSDIGRRVRMWTHDCRVNGPSTGKLGELVRLDPSYAWVRFDGDPIVRAVIRDILTWVRS